MRPESSSRPESGSRPESASSRPLPRNRYVVYFVIALAGAAADLATKQATFAWLGLPHHFVDKADAGNLDRWLGDPELAHRWWLVEGRLGVETSVNTGALFGMAPGWWWLFSLISIGAALGILTWLFVFKAARDRWLNVALAFVTGGILGNLYDRLGLWDATGLLPQYHHGVRDWILFTWPESGIRLISPWPNFNIADSMLVTGAIMLVVHALVWREKSDETAKSEAVPARKPI